MIWIAILIIAVPMFAFLATAIGEIRAHERATLPRSPYNTRPGRAPLRGAHTSPSPV